ncbi:rhamnulokinase [Geobacillus thermoleovorans]|uniref:rhamnulokinase n=1 Tax=Geobacillus TaxID=129337 RepID=UPI00078DDDFB|nr:MULTISPECIES: rhamnulokinase [Geobacillus]AMQ20568.1 rhamnulokinase [Geobacillus sp. JS12]MCG6794024.1 rhamnulokinase [Geobacillus sp. YHL]UPT59443.1 rhamnulokinase [Geobacillus thermoleovorans]
MMECCLAVDIGASSGRVMAGWIKGGQIQLVEVHRFANEMIQKGNHFCWDVAYLFAEIKKGIQLCREKGLRPTSIGVDTWAVDFVLLDERGHRLTDAVAYRDPRTDGMMEKVFDIVGKERLYERTGIQFQKFNTIYQLYALKQEAPDVLERAHTFLMIPDYFHYLLTGRTTNEYTNATTTQLVNAQTKTWDVELVRELGLKETMFQPLQLPKTVLGPLRKDIAEELGVEMTVILPATHDTASAVAAVPELDDTIYLSSGTWSLMGVECHEPICSPKARSYNFTNEGGIDYRFRFLKNIMGLWMIQEVRRNYGNQYSFAELADLARAERHFHAIVNVDDERFLKPENMIAAIQAYCRETNQPVPETPAQVAKCVFDSLVVSYQKTVDEMEETTGRTFQQINVIGGGCQNEWLNEMIADATGKTVYAGPVEATAIGNLIAQWLALGKVRTLEEARLLVRQSFPLKKFVPKKGE